MIYCMIYFHSLYGFVSDHENSLIKLLHTTFDPLAEAMVDLLLIKLAATIILVARISYSET